MEVIGLDDLVHLREISRRDRLVMFARNPHWRAYEDRLLCVALAQGAALHYLDRQTGVKDFDVWTFFARSSHRKHPDPALYRRHKTADFGVSCFGRSPGAPSWIRGRRVDLLARSLNVGPPCDPVDAVRKWLKDGRTVTARRLAAKAVIMIEPTPGTVVWPS